MTARHDDFVSWFEEISRALSATLLLLRGDRQGLALYNNTVTGFWRSFVGILLIAPLYLFINNINLTSAAEFHFSPGPELIGLGLQWILWPLIMVLVTRWTKLGHHFARYMIVYNWSNVVIIAFMAFPAVLYKIGLLPLVLAAQIIGILQLLSFYLEWYLARLSLETSGAIAAAIVLGNFVLSAAVFRIIG